MTALDDRVAGTLSEQQRSRRRAGGSRPSTRSPGQFPSPPARAQTEPVG
jgi:hypothetical protein